jgi:hypothetical protein
MDRTCDPCRVKAVDRHSDDRLSEGETPCRPPETGHAHPVIAPEMHPASCMPVQHWIKLQGQRCDGIVDNSPEPPSSCVLSPSGQGAVTPRAQQLGGFCVLRLGAPHDANDASLYRLPRNRPAPTTNRTCRPAVGKASGLRSMRDGVTGSACSESHCPSLALGLECTEAGIQMETVNSPYHPAAAMSKGEIMGDCFR